MSHPPSTPSSDGADPDAVPPTVVSSTGVAAMSPAGVSATRAQIDPGSSGGGRAGVQVEDARSGDRRALEAELASARQELAGLRAALVSRATIDQARGILIARYQISADGAFELLVRWSQDRNIKLRLIAETLVALAQHGAEAPGVDRSLGGWLSQQLSEHSVKR